MLEMAAPAMCSTCVKPYADRTGSDPCPRCGTENPSVDKARRRAASDRLKVETEKAREATRESEQAARLALEAHEALVLKAAQALRAPEPARPAATEPLSLAISQPVMQTHPLLGAGGLVLGIIGVPLTASGALNGVWLFAFGGLSLAALGLWAMTSTVWWACPQCAEPVRKAAKRCPHCREPIG